FPSPSRRVAPRAALFDGREGGWALLRDVEEGACGRRDALASQRGRCPRLRPRQRRRVLRLLGVQGRRAEPEGDPGQVLLVAGGKERRQLRRLFGEEDQDA